ncbi:MAG: TrmH family RNA methyltransferase [Solirubrobacteraceae bacterium]
MRDGSLIPRFGRARRDPSKAVLEGFHPIKHALRFGAEIEELLTRDAAELARLAALLAPEEAERLDGQAREVDAELFAQLAPLAPTTGVIALARRPAVDPRAVLDGPGSAPVIVLEDPRDLGNMGACVRVAAAADAGGVLTTGSHDPWHPDALRGAAGLHYAVAVARLGGLGELRERERPLIALDPQGEPLAPGELDPRALLAFGTERHGLSPGLLGEADACLSIPMRPGVSSLNLATSVAAVLFAWRLSARP